tara:strand:+ start:244 stop:459 length:216 start_codon:yes stop_codon:yes gene_type:complete
MSGSRLQKIISDSGLLSRRNRQILRMASLFGHPAQDLERISISNIKLNDLKKVQWCEINCREWIPIIKENM